MGNYLGESISSVLDGSFDKMEIIIVDDGSEDNTKGVVKKFIDEKSPKYDPRVRYYYQRNSGKPTALNHALQYVRGSYVAFVDADDRLPADGLSARYEAVKSASGVSPELVVGGFEVFRGDETLGRRPSPERTDPDFLRRQFLFSYKTPFHLNSCLIDRSLLSRVGLFDENLRRSDDQDYILRMLEAVEEVCVINKSVYRYRKYRESMKSRMRYRLVDIVYRPKMISKNTKGIEKIMSIVMGFIFDLAKLVYQIKSSYHN